MDSEELKIKIPTNIADKMTDEQISDLVLGDDGEDEGERNASAVLKKWLIDFVGFGFYLYELFTFLTTHHIFNVWDFSAVIFSVKFVLVLIALPLLYLFKLAKHFDLVAGLASTFSRKLKDEDETQSFKDVVIFYNAINVLLMVLVVIEVIERIVRG